jgi:heat shock protein HtpX
MQMIKRMGLFFLVNILVTLTISLVLGLLGVGRTMTAYGIDYQNLAILCLAWGMIGSFISLLMSRMMAKWTMGVKLIDPQTRDTESKWLLDTVYRLARQAGLTTMPEVGVYDSPELNAFATGPSRSRSLVAVSTRLLRSMDQNEISGVLGHEIAHVANGDMVTMTLIQGVVNAFVMFLSRVLAFFISQALRGNQREEGRSYGGGMVQFAIQMLLETVFMLLGSMVVAWFSRQREFRADAGGAQYAGRSQMISALQALQRRFEPTEVQKDSFSAMKISGGGLMTLLSTHPKLELRIARLQGRTVA